MARFQIFIGSVFSASESALALACGIARGAAHDAPGTLVTVKRDDTGRDEARYIVVDGKLKPWVR